MCFHIEGKSQNAIGQVWGAPDWVSQLLPSPQDIKTWLLHARLHKTKKNPFSSTSLITYFILMTWLYKIYSGIPWVINYCIYCVNVFHHYMWLWLFQGTKQAKVLSLKTLSIHILRWSIVTLRVSMIFNQYRLIEMGHLKDQKKQKKLHTYSLMYEMMKTSTCETWYYITGQKKRTENRF